MTVVATVEETLELLVIEEETGKEGKEGKKEGKGRGGWHERFGRGR